MRQESGDRFSLLVVRDPLCQFGTRSGRCLMGVTGSATYPVHNELRPRGVDARAPSALERVPSMRFDASAIRLHRTSDVATYFLPQARIARGAVPYRLFPSRTRRSPHISTRQYARIVGQWVSSYPFLADVRRESSSVARGSSGPSVLSPSRSVETLSSLAGSRHPSTS